jgi:hypothetical protein
MRLFAKPISHNKRGEALRPMHFVRNFEPEPRWRSFDTSTVVFIGARPG